MVFQGFFANSRGRTTHERNHCCNAYYVVALLVRLQRDVRMMSQLCLGLFVSALLWFAAVDTTTAEATSRPLYNVGYQTLDLAYRQNGQEMTLTVAVWYPTAAQPGRVTYGGRTVGTVAVNGTPLATDSPYPLLIFSHGYGGGGIGSVFFTEALAARGWIVVCPDHHDRHSAVRIRTGQVENFDRSGLLRHGKEIAASGPADRYKYQYRLDEMRIALDGMLNSVLFANLIDRDRIAVGGHSFGGFAALGLSGTIKERHDPRIKAIVLFSTGAGGYLFRDDELASVRVPSMLFMGEREKDQTRGTQTMAQLSARIFRNMSVPKYFLTVKGASHFSFNNSFGTDFRAKLLSGTDQQFDVIRRYSIAFLEKYVAGRTSAEHLLEQNDPQLVRYDRETAIGASHRKSGH